MDTATCGTLVAGPERRSLPKGDAMNRFSIALVRDALALAVVLAAAAASAQDDHYVPPKLESKLDPHHVGWVPKLGLGASFSFAHSSNVVGAQDGQTWNIGPLVDFGLEYYEDPHEWRNGV